ncbi:hypothetical protein B5G50_27925 [Brevibacillus brevis]|uniref:hypothetical protein n=1 Tax=Brevibacillus brevis TaxID=1393 RepID=UPI000B38ECE5|nr:hypothetical protein [Brevibacillus brevis]OUQ85220.1 hypothetical protein B5G50_27925 [Brevibacillus brevis]
MEDKEKDLQKVEQQEFELVSSAKDNKEAEIQEDKNVSNKSYENKITVSENKEKKFKKPVQSYPPHHTGELDMGLKIKFKKILWQMGHYGRIDVKIAGYGEEALGRRDGIGELTDIDVLGFNFQDDFHINNIIVDCKNGENVSPSNRLFWIKGVMDNSVNSRGYMVMGKKVIPTHLRDLANKFNISLMDGKNITALERIYDIAGLDELDIFSEELFYKQERINDKSIMELIEYRKYHYWIDEDHTKLHNIINLLTKYADRLSSTNKNHQIIVMDLIILFTIALFKLCSYIMRTSLSDVKNGVILYLYNGIYNLDKYRSVLNLVGKMLKATAKNFNEIKEVFEYQPRFFESLVELCITILRRPKESKDILRYMDVAMYSTIMPVKDSKKSVIDVLNSDFNEITNKLMFDIFDFVEKSTLIDSKLIPRKLIYM